MKHLSLALTLLVLGACGGDAVPDSPTAAAAGLTVDAAWLADNADAADVVVLQVAPDDAEAPLVPGARALPLSAVAIEREGNVNELPPLDEMRSAFERVGVGDSTRVVLIGEPLHAARAFVALDVLGHTRASLLDGGYSAWAAVDRPAVNTAAPSAGARITSAPRTDRIVDATYVRERVNRDQVHFIDARPDEQFHEGRIPGAAPLFWQNTLMSSAEPRLRSTDELHSLFDDAGGETATELVVYCRTGMQASFLYFVARHLGYDVRMYDGSYADWTARGLPVER